MFAQRSGRGGTPNQASLKKHQEWCTVAWMWIGVVNDHDSRHVDPPQSREQQEVEWPGHGANRQIGTHRRQAANELGHYKRGSQPPTGQSENPCIGCNWDLAS